MDFEEYRRLQIETSEWTRRNPISRALVADSLRAFFEVVPASATVLEIGCGDGYSMDLLRARGHQRLMGADLHLGKLADARAAGHAVAVQDVHLLALADDCVDAVYCTHTLEHTHNAYTAMTEIARVLRPGGTAFLIVPDHSRLYGDTFVTREAVVPLHRRDSWQFEERARRRGATPNTKPRNQFPFTMRLLLEVVQSAGLEVQWARRIQRDGPELWCVASKPEAGRDDVAPLTRREYQRRTPSSLPRRILHHLRVVLKSPK